MILDTVSSTSKTPVLDIMKGFLNVFSKTVPSVDIYPSSPAYGVVDDKPQNKFGLVMLLVAGVIFYFIFKK